MNERIIEKQRKMNKKKNEEKIRRKNKNNEYE